MRKQVPTPRGWAEASVLQKVELSPLEALNTPNHQKTYQEALACSYIEDLARKGIVTLVWGLETHLETVLKSPFSEPNPSIISLIQGAEAPIHYTRPLSPDSRLAFLRGISNRLFDKWKQALGVVTDSTRETNQLMDAWHLWTAEHNNCDYFITADQKMIKSNKSRKITTEMAIVSPTEFIEALNLKQ